VSVGLLGDQGEVALGVGVAVHQVRVVTQPLIEPGHLPEPAVVGHDPPAHGERVRVGLAAAARGGPPHVRHERGGPRLPGLVDELLVAERGLGLLVQHRPAVGAEEPDAGPVHVAVTLHGQ
jgi:hypothetical protein